MTVGAHQITFSRTVAAAHRLQHDPGKCSRIHGHGFTFNVAVSTDALDADLMIVHFDRVKEIIDQFDHRLLLEEGDPLAHMLEFKLHGRGVGGDVYPVEGQGEWIVVLPAAPTSEFLAHYVAEQILAIIPQGDDGATPLARTYVEVLVTVQETANLAATANAMWTRAR